MKSRASKKASLLPLEAGSRSFEEVDHRFCHRCGSQLHTENEGALFFCWNCAAPQVFISEELKQKASDLRLAQSEPGQEGGAASDVSSQIRESIVWSSVINLAAIVAAAFSLLSLLLSPMALLVWLWAPLAPGIVLSLYAARNRSTQLNGRNGARVGAVCGLLVIGGLATVNALHLDISRFLFHRMADFDTNINVMLNQIKVQAEAQSGQPAGDVFKLLDIPEFRTGFFLTSFGMLSAFVLMLTTAGGALAGHMRSRRQAA